MCHVGIAIRIHRRHGFPPIPGEHTVTAKSILTLLCSAGLCPGSQRYTVPVTEPVT